VKHNQHKQYRGIISIIEQNAPALNKEELRNLQKEMSKEY